ncbi:unnamed protein product [Enterobius vermicularis]|uniref:Fibronectin type-III domain-containing protein n=1 Tax=Enterobius vermicularis TaxID=51028 RepID=A0A0N4VKL9_ENTVE|nr:unnamed protein product [Enterobius vermicularis]
MANFVLLFSASIIVFTVNSFLVIPYEFVELSSRLNVAKCQAKCAIKFGTPIRRRQNNGKVVIYWINNSEEAKKIESFPTATVEALLPHIRYKLLVWKVNKVGIVGRPTESAWFEVLTTDFNEPAYRFSVINHFDFKNGISFLVRGPINYNENAVSLVSQTCDYSITLENSTHCVSKTVTLDESDAIILPKLQYSSGYRITVYAWKNLNISSNQNMELDNRIYSINKTTPRCEDYLNFADVQCEFKLHAEVLSAGIVKVEWNPPISFRRIYIYRLEYDVVGTSKDGKRMQTLQTNFEFLDAATTSTVLQVPHSGVKTYNIRLTCFNKRIEGIDAEFQLDNVIVRLVQTDRTQFTVLSCSALLAILLLGHFTCGKLNRKPTRAVSPDVKTVIYYI